MNYLAINTTSEKFEVIVSKCGERFTYRENGKRASDTLLPAIDELLDEAGLTLKDVDCYACVIGPGSFMGIRIGVNTVKTFAFVTGKKIVAINSIEKLAYNKSASESRGAQGFVYAYANNCYVGAYDSRGNVLSEPEMITLEEAKERLRSSELTAVCDETAAVKLGGDADDSLYSLAAAVEAAIERGDEKDYREIEPFYLIKSQAERERGE